MSTQITGPDLRVDVARWQGCRIPKNEITGALTFLALKTGKAVHCGLYHGTVHYAAECIHVLMCTATICQNPIPVHHVKLAGTEHELESTQAVFKVSQPGEEIKDEEGRVLARVDHNNIVILLEFTAADNQAGRAILSHVVEHAMPLLDFDIADKIKDLHTETVRAYNEFHKSALRSRIDQKTRELQQLERESTDLYYRLVSAEQALPTTKQELSVLEKLVEGENDPIIEKQAEGILGLLANGQYEEITPANDGSLFARTSQILIEHDDWVFELGRYEINIDSPGKVTIYSADGTDADGYPHPHVDSNGRPCLGNISADLAKAIGRMRVAEALTLLYDFISSYNEDGPYIRIGKFDPAYNDPDEDPCEDCQDYHSPYCICECSHNDGNYCCSDCCEYRTDYCYTECSYNVPGFNYCSPCDDCEESEEHCFLECEHNSKWEVNSPCNECDKSDCEGCDYAEKKEELARSKKSATVA